MMPLSTTILSSLSQPFRTAISRVDKAMRASPLEKLAMKKRSSSSISIFFPSKERGSVIARFNKTTMSSADSCFKTKTLQRDSKAPLTSKEGFSVVAPIRMIAPFSTKGRKASCWALLKRWISSTKTMVRSPILVSSSARFMTSLISLMPLVTAEKLMKLALVVLAMTLARVVLPTPGGPQKIMEGMRSDSTIRLKTLPSPIRCCWPMISSRLCGLSLAASGSFI